MSLSKANSNPLLVINKEVLNINKFTLFFKSLLEKIKNNKNKLILSSCLFGMIFYFYKYYLASKVDAALDFYKTISEFKELYAENDSFQQVIIKYEPCFNNLSKKLLTEIKYKLNSVSNLEELYNKVKNSKREEMLFNWNNLKNKSLLIYFTSIIISRFVILISQSHLLILEKMQVDNQKIPKNICDELLTDLWILATNFLDNLIEQIDDEIGEEIISIHISCQFSWNLYSKKLKSLQDKVLDLFVDNLNHEIKLKLFKNYVLEISKKIDFLESQNFYFNKSNQNIEVFLKFYQIYYDVLNSNLFHVILLKAINNDFSIVERDMKFKIDEIILEEMQQSQNILNKNISLSEETEKNIDSSNIKINSEENSLLTQQDSHKIKLIKILIIMLKVNGNMLDSNSSLLIYKNENLDKKFNEELIEYFKIIYD